MNTQLKKPSLLENDISEYLVKDPNNQYRIVQCWPGEVVKETSIKLPKGTDQVYLNGITGNYSFWRNGTEYFHHQLEEWKKLSCLGRFQDHMELVWDRYRPVGSFYALADFSEWDSKVVEDFDLNSVAPESVEVADSEFIQLLELITHKKLSDTHKNILCNILNSNI